MKVVCPNCDAIVPVPHVKWAGEKLESLDKDMLIDIVRDQQLRLEEQWSELDQWKQLAMAARHVIAEDGNK